MSKKSGPWGAVELAKANNVYEAVADLCAVIEAHSRTAGELCEDPEAIQRLLVLAARDLTGAAGVLYTTKMAVASARHLAGLRMKEGT